MARRLLRLMGLVALILLVYFLVPVEDPLHPDNLLRTTVAVVSLGLLAAGMVRLLRAHLEDDERRVEGLVLGIVVVVVFFAFAYYLLARHDPHQVAGLHTRIDALYFTMSTLSTIGFGDVHASGQAARALVIAQVVFDLVFVAAAAGLVAARRSGALHAAEAEVRGGVPRAVRLAGAGAVALAVVGEQRCEPPLVTNRSSSRTAGAAEALPPQHGAARTA